MSRRPPNPGRVIRIYLAVVGISILALVAVHFGLLWTKVHAHDRGRPELNDWLMGLRAKGGAACCDGSDAMRLNDVDWETRDGHYRVRLEGEWVDVPDNAVIDGPNKAGQTMVWPFYIDGHLRGVRCFVPGTMT